MFKNFFGCFSFFLFLSFLYPVFLSAQQNTVLEPADHSTESKDSLSILIIPYNPQYYLSDSDRQIAEASKRSVLTIRDNFRTSLDHSLKKQFSEKYYTQSVLTDTSEQAGLDLSRIYHAQILKYEQSPSFKKEEKKSRKKSSRKEKNAGLDKATVVTDNSFLDDSFMNVTFSDSELLPELAARYENDYFIFLNQFEIRIDYNDCLDLAKKIYNRRLKVHYSVYDNTGNYITGDYVNVKFPSTTNHVDEIISRNFYHVARQLAEAF